METSRVLNNFNFPGKLMEFLFQMTLSLVMAEAAQLSFVFTSFVELPSFDNVKTKYLSLEAVYFFWFLRIQRDGSCCLLGAAIHQRLWFSPSLLPFHILLRCPFQSGGVPVRSWISASLPPMRSMPYAKLRLHSGRPPMEMEVWSLLMHPA